MQQVPTLQIDAAFIFSLVALLTGIYSAVVAFFIKREIAGFDNAKKTAYEKEREITIMKAEQRQQALDIMRANDKADDIVINYKASFKELNTKIDLVTELINAINLTLATHVAREGSRN